MPLAVKTCDIGQGWYGRREGEVCIHFLQF